MSIPTNQNRTAQAISTDIDVLGLVRATILVTDELGTIVQAHGGAGRPLGYAANELVGKHGVDFVAPEDHPLMAGLFASQDAPIVAIPQPFPIRVVAPDGTSRVWDCIPSGYDQAGRKGWIVTLMCREEQNPSIDAMECFIAGGTPLEIAHVVAQRDQGELTGGWRKTAMVIHRDLSPETGPGPWTLLPTHARMDPAVVNALHSCLNQAGAPWSTLEPGAMGACELPEPLRSAAARAGLDHAAATAVGVDDITSIVFLRLSDFPMKMHANNKLSDLAVTGILQRALSAERSRSLLDHAMRSDPLTGVSNRRHFEEVIGERRDTSADAALFVDIDRFKKVNDTFGHAIGDATLRMVAERITRACRTHDTVARVGGDEFAIILRDVTAAETQAIAARIRTLMAEPLDMDAAPDTVSVTVGVAIPGDENTLAGLVQRADQAMLADKAANRQGP